MHSIPWIWLVNVRMKTTNIQSNSIGILYCCITLLVCFFFFFSSLHHYTSRWQEIGCIYNKAAYLALFSFLICNILKDALIVSFATCYHAHILTLHNALYWETTDCCYSLFYIIRKSDNIKIINMKSFSQLIF